MRDIRFGYGEKRVLNGFDMDIRRGEMVGLVGASGKGKTTVLHLLLGFLEPQGGQILVNARITGGSARRGYWSQVSYVKQQAFLMHDTVKQNIVLGKTPVDDRRLERAMNTAGLNIEERLVSSAGRDISGGQRQRIAIARPCIKMPD